jgi:hypothetical protein
MSDKQYPIGGYAPGNYSCKCCVCGAKFIGDKRAVECEPCAMKDKEAFDKLSPEAQVELINRNAEAARQLFENWNKPAASQPPAVTPTEEYPKLTPEQIKERKEAIEWYRGGHEQSGNTGELPVVVGPHWIKTSERPLIETRGNRWFATVDGEKDFIAAVPYKRLDHGNKILWWVRHCCIEDGRLCVVGDDDHEIAGWEIEAVEYWMPWPGAPDESPTAAGETDPEEGPAQQAASKWVFETNGHKWSNNNNEAGDNYSSFIAGWNAAKATAAGDGKGVIEFTEWIMSEGYEPRIGYYGTNRWFHPRSRTYYGTAHLYDDYLKSKQQK